MRSLLRLLLPCVLAFSPLAAAVRVPAILGSHMVLQQRASVPVWGWANAAETVVVTTSWSTNVIQATASNGGRWTVNLQTPEAGGPHSIRIKAGNEIVLEDVLIGEVWLCSGQSNMEWSGELGVRQSREEAPGATPHLLRFFHGPKATADAPQDHVDARWVVCNPEEMQRFSAIGYFFGKQIHERLNAPVGIINSSWGGTPAEVWTPREVVEAAPDLRAAAAELKPFAWWPHQPGLAYNAMIHPLLPFRIAGVLWYQGESNVPTHATYRKLFTYMIDAWRAAWKSELPVYFVQIAPFNYDGSDASAFLREAQLKSLGVPNTGMVSTMDLGNARDIHPDNKQEVGRRLAAHALATTYGKTDIAFAGPMPDGHVANGKSIRVVFTHTFGGLVAKGDLTGFQIAGADRVFFPAKVEIDGESIVLTSEKVPNPVAARYGWEASPTPTLFNGAGFPATSFRTDDWNDKLPAARDLGKTSHLTDDPAFKPIFNGKDLSGWINVNTGPSTWAVRDGIIACSGHPTGVIRTDRQYENFVLEMEWRHLVPGGNAGLFVWSDPICAKGQPFTRSLEVQVMDGQEGDWYTSDGDIFPIHGATMKPENGRGNGNRAFPTEKRMNPAPKWNH